MHTTVESLTGTAERTLDPERLINLGSATRSAAEAQAHQREVAEEGIRIAFDVPAPRIYPISLVNLTSDDTVTVHGPRTSGEVEIVLIDDGELLVSVGSDHTDRDLERHSIVWSKQACANVMARTSWLWSDVEDHWDSVTLACDIDGEPYQRMPASVFLDPPSIIETVRSRTFLADESIVVFCGTYASIDRKIRFGDRWSFRMDDPILDRSISHDYRVVNLMDDVRPEYRVPLAVDPE